MLNKTARPVLHLATPRAQSPARSRSEYIPPPQNPHDLARLERLYERHREIEADFPEAWMDYGPLDPINDGAETANACARCNTTEHLEIVEAVDHPGQVQVHCSGCGALGNQRYTAWRAWMIWNTCELSASPSWRDIGYFGLSEISEEEARERLIHLFERLDVSSELAQLAYKLGKPIGKLFATRMEAYKHWAEYAIRLFDQQHPDQRIRAPRKRARGGKGQGDAPDVTH